MRKQISTLGSLFSFCPEFLLHYDQIIMTGSFVIRLGWQRNPIALRTWDDLTAMIVLWRALKPTRRRCDTSCSDLNTFSLATSGAFFTSTVVIDVCGWYP